MKRKLMAIIVCFISTQASFSASWSWSENPKYFNIEEEVFENMALSAHLDLDKTGIWSGYHWPNKVNNIDYKPKNQKMSPLEKWESITSVAGKYNIREMINPYIGNKETVNWGGLCHGYSATALNFPEPTKRTVEGITFFHSDIKALLAAYYDYLLMNNLVSSKYLGKRCDTDLPQEISFGEKFSKECNDINPGVFHLALNHMINIKKRGIVMDMNSGNEVWNVPIIGYDSEILNDDYPKYSQTALWTRKVVHIKTTISYLGYQKPEHDFETRGRKGQKIKRKTYEYTLELDRKGRVIGGEWFHSDRPDFLWVSDEIPYPSGEWQLLSDLLLSEDLPKEESFELILQ